MRHLAWAVAFFAFIGLGYAADQTILGAGLGEGRRGVDPTKRKVVGQAKEAASPNSIVGDPTTNGAVLTIFVEGASSSNQVFNLGAGTDPATGKPYWSASGSGFKYRDKTGTNSAVKVSQITKSSSGTFQIKAVAQAKSVPIALVPPDPGTSACMLFEINGGDRYHVLFPPASNSSIKKNDARTFQIREALTEGLCPETLTTTTSTTTTTTIPLFCVDFYQPCGSTCGGRGRCLDGAGGLVCVDLTSCVLGPFPAAPGAVPAGSSVRRQQRIWRLIPVLRALLRVWNPSVRGGSMSSSNEAFVMPAERHGVSSVEIAHDGQHVPIVEEPEARRHESPVFLLHEAKRAAARHSGDPRAQAPEGCVDRPVDVVAHEGEL